MNLKTIIGCFAAYLIILFRHGYIFGSGDQSEMLPYAKYLADNSLYSKDFYIQSVAAFVPNERLIFSKGLSFFFNYLPEFTFAAHSIATIFLILGLFNWLKYGLLLRGGVGLPRLLQFLFCTISILAATNCIITH